VTISSYNQLCCLERGPSFPRRIHAIIINFGCAIAPLLCGWHAVKVLLFAPAHALFLATDERPVFSFNLIAFGARLVTQ